MADAAVPPRIRTWLELVEDIEAACPRERPQLRSIRSQINQLERETAELLGVPVEKPRLTLIEGGRDG